MGSKIIEDEEHFLYTCDLYADLRSKLITNLNKSPPSSLTESNSANSEDEILEITVIFRT